jgi:hypothetical protein
VDLGRVIGVGADPDLGGDVAVGGIGQIEVRGRRAGADLQGRVVESVQAVVACVAD